MVEHVEEFGAKLEFGALRNREVLKQREIPNLVARSLNAVAADITEGASWWIREGARVEEGIGHTGFCTWIPDQVGTLLAIRVGDAVII